jgi:hypothetical protein
MRRSAVSSAGNDDSDRESIGHNTWEVAPFISHGFISVGGVISPFDFSGTG